MQHSQNLERLQFWSVNDEVGEYSIKQNLLACQVWTPMPAVRDFVQSVKAFEEFGYNAIRSIHAWPLQKVQPNGINIDNRIVS
jgi:hypothetical protein